MLCKQNKGVYAVERQEADRQVRELTVPSIIWVT